jgi:hypothetical protein
MLFGDPNVEHKKSVTTKNVTTERIDTLEMKTETCEGGGREEREKQRRERERERKKTKRKSKQNVLKIVQILY